MNKKILAIMIAAALLQGCASYRQLESTRKESRCGTTTGTGNDV
ncbi:Bundle-forming pilus B [Escherichia coli]|nr:hypothetical protein [Escherichia coli]STJ46960.1 Bundle-forming pilus B [Escherichia coli]